MERQRRRMYLLVLSLLAASFMIFQIAVLRELRFQLNTIFTLAPFLFSSVILFMGLGSLEASAARWNPAGLHGVLRWGVAALPLMLLPLFAVTILVASAVSPLQPMAVSGDQYLSSVIAAFILAAVLGYGGVFFLQGLIFALYFREGRQAGILSNVYAIDLIASGSAALVGGMLLFLMTPIQMVMVATAGLLATVWVSYRDLKIPFALVVAVTAVLLVMVTTEHLAGPIAQAESLRWRGRGLSFSVWSPYRRIDVVEDSDGLLVFTDGLLFQKYAKGESPHTWDPRTIPVRLIPPDDGMEWEILVIGAGTGSDVRILRDMDPRQHKVVAVEIDEGFIRTARAVPWLWSKYSTADIVIQEGRYFLEHTEQVFDMVLYAYVDPQSAISKIGLPDANFLYTDAGIRSAYRRVREDGILAITRVFLVEQQEEFVRRLCATLSAAGISREQTALYRHKGSVRWGYYGELATLHAFIGKGGNPPLLQDEQLISLDWSVGARPTTDFFPFSLVTNVWFGTLGRYLTGQPLMVIMLAVFVVALVARLSTSVGHLNFFLLGFGSLLVECLVLFNSFLLIGNPVLSAAIAIGFFLIWNGIGSRYSERLQKAKAFFLLVPAAVLLYAVTAPLLNAYAIDLPIWSRTVAFSLHLAVAGVAVGAMFPISLRVFRAERVASMFFIDLVGCSVAPVGFWLAMSLYGVSLVVAAGVASYLVVAIILLARR